MIDKINDLKSSNQSNQITLILIVFTFYVKLSDLEILFFSQFVFLIRKWDPKMNFCNFWSLVFHEINM